MKSTFTMLFLVASAALGPAHAQQGRPEPVPQWQSVTWNRGVQAAAFCLTKDHDGPMSAKSMKHGTCAADVTRWPFLLPVTEHGVGRLAIQSACFNVSVGGVPVSSLGALDLIRVCQCHNTSAQRDIATNAPAVMAALKRWGGC